MSILIVSGLAMLSLIMPHLGAATGHELAGASIPARTSIAVRDTTPVRVGLVLQPYTARRGADEISVAPELLRPEVVSVLRQLEVELAGSARVELTPEEEDLYGVWRRLALADAHLGAAVTSMYLDRILGHLHSDF